MPQVSSSAKLCVYCAGPLFNSSERNEMARIADLLVAHGYRVYLPHRDGMEFRLIHGILIERGWEPPDAAQFLHAAIFALDVYQLAVECDCLVWNLNGRVPDEGAVSEAAMAWTLGKPLVAYRDDVRSLIAGRVNPLLVGMVDFQTVDELDDIPHALELALARKNQPPLPQEQFSEKMR
ncbi:MAG TPA: nucleoside 2-deoxyribosyltransferase, partial [Planctomycetaceae bacterium]|nr:nucleoside 2-deoxyribosyltransferase [Planctomycetaceae bacterium]